MEGPFFPAPSDRVLIPRERLQVFWETSGDSAAIGEVFVCDLQLEEEDPVAYEAAADRFDNDLGASVAGWLELNGLNPERLFGHLLGQGFASPMGLAHALSEFSKVEGCEWASDMLQGFNWR